MEIKNWIFMGALTLGLCSSIAVAEESEKNNQKKEKPYSKHAGSVLSNDKKSFIWKDKEKLVEKEANTFEEWILDCPVSITYVESSTTSRLYAMYFETADEIVFCKPSGISRFFSHENAHYLTDDKGIKGLFFKKQYQGPSWKDGTLQKMLRDEETPALRKFRQSYLIDRLDEVVQERIKQTVAQLRFVEENKLQQESAHVMLKKGERINYINKQYAEIIHKNWDNLSYKLQRYKEFITYLKNVDKNILIIHTLAKVSNKKLLDLPNNEKEISRCERDYDLSIKNLYHPKEVFARYVTALNHCYVGEPTYEKFPMTPSLCKVFSQMKWKNKKMWARDLKKLDLAEKLKIAGYDPEDISKKLRYASDFTFNRKLYKFPAISPKIKLRDKIKRCQNIEMLRYIHNFYK